MVELQGLKNLKEKILFDKILKNLNQNLQMIK